MAQIAAEAAKVAVLLGKTVVIKPATTESCEEMKPQKRSFSIDPTITNSEKGKDFAKDLLGGLPIKMDLALKDHGLIKNGSKPKDDDTGEKHSKKEEENSDGEWAGFSAPTAEPPSCKFGTGSTDARKCKDYLGLLFRSLREYTLEITIDPNINPPAQGKVWCVAKETHR